MTQLEFKLAVFKSFTPEELVVYLPELGDYLHLWMRDNLNRDVAEFVNSFKQDYSGLV